MTLACFLKGDGGRGANRTGMNEATAATAEAFVARWAPSGGAERSNYAVFLTELCDVLGVPRPEPAGPDDRHNAYVFDRHVTFQNGDGTTSPGFIDLYKRGCFVLEAKQGTEQQRQAAGELAGPAPRLRRGRRRGNIGLGWGDAGGAGAGGPVCACVAGRGGLAAVSGRGGRGVLHRTVRGLFPVGAGVCAVPGRARVPGAAAGFG
jgi:hypothetical protein